VAGLRRFSIEDIARMFNVSPIFLQEYSNSTYSNFSEASRAFLTMTMRPWLANFEQQIKSALLVASPVPGIRYQVEFDSADLLRATQPNVTPLMSAGSRTVMNPNEARTRGMPPREGGDEYSQAWKQEVKISKGAVRTVTNESRRTEKPRTIRNFTTSSSPSGQVIQKWEDGETIWAE
jgi:phage portal protein BeeE